MNDIEMLFEEVPVRGRKVKPLKVKTKPNPLDGVSSWAILRELLIRHYIDLQVVGFWTVLAIIVWIKLGR